MSLDYFMMLPKPWYTGLLIGAVSFLGGEAYGAYRQRHSDRTVAQLDQIRERAVSRKVIRDEQDLLKIQNNLVTEQDRAQMAKEKALYWDLRDEDRLSGCKVDCPSHQQLKRILAMPWKLRAPEEPYWDSHDR